MDVKELRGGNLLQRKAFNPMPNNEDYYFEDVKVIGIHNYIYYTVGKRNEIHKSNNLYPIPLTEQRLIEFGFEKREDGDYNLFKQSEVDIVLKEDFSSWTCDGINFSVNYIEYVHQLQNLYYSLTGNELK